MADVFVSYAREDKAKAARFVEALEGVGWSVFWDHDVLAGHAWRSTIEAELNTARVVVAIWSAASRTSEWVLEEAQIAHRRNVLVPVRFEMVEPPFGFSGVHVEELDGWDGSIVDARFARVLDALAVQLGTPSIPPALARVQRLLRIIQDGGDLQDRRDAAGALGQLYDEIAPVVPAVAAALQRADDALIREQLIQALARAKEAARSAVPLLCEIVRTDPAPAVRKAAARDLGWITQGTDEALPVLLDVARTDSDDGVRASATWALAEAGDAGFAAIQPAIDFLSDVSEDVRRSAIHVLYMLAIDSEPALRALMQCARTDLAMDVRRSAVFTLSRVAKENVEAIATFVDIMRTDDEMWVRASAAEALGCVGPPTEIAVDALLEKLHDFTDDTEVREEAAASLTQFGPFFPRATNMLIELLRKDVSAQVRERAAEGLGYLETPSSEIVANLVAALGSDRVPEVRVAIVQTLGKFAHLFSDQVAPALQSAAERDKSRDVRAAATEVLNDVGF